MRKGLFDKPAPTTNNTEPQRPEYPAVRTPAKGPLISTENTAVPFDRDVADVEVGKTIPVKAKPGRKPKK